MFFAYLFSVDCLPWEILTIIKLTENDTTSSSRIFIKELYACGRGVRCRLQKLSNQLGLKELNERFNNPELRRQILGMFPENNSNDVRFAINFYTSIGLGGLTCVCLGVLICRQELRKTLEELKAKRMRG